MRMRPSSQHAHEPQLPGRTFSVCCGSGAAPMPAHWSPTAAAAASASA